MASSGDGVGHLSSTSLVFGEGTSTLSRNGRDRKGLRTPQAVKEEITGNSRILAELGWDSVTSPLWTCNTAKKYVKMHHIDKLFLEAMWEYNHRVSGVKPDENKSKHFAHRALEVSSALYPDKPFGPKYKNIISYSMAAMVYAEIELKRKVDWRTVFTRNKEDRTEYAKVDVPDNFSFFRQNVGVGPILDARGANRNTSRSTKTVREEDSVGNAICLTKSGSRYEDEEGASAKEVQNELQLQKERSDMFMSFVDGETNKVDIRKLLRELEHLQEQINKQDVDQVVDSVLNDVLDNDVSEFEPRASGPEGNHPRRFRKWSEVEDMIIFQIRIRYHCQISRHRITRQFAR
jgi:hypothetical protein